jgi:putative hydrolase of the HAD superfamily
MNPRAIVFDFGNVIGFFSHRRATERLAPLSKLDADTFHRFVFGSVLEDRYERGAISTEEFRSTIKQECGLSCADDFFDEAYGDIFWHNRALCDLLPELASRYPLLLLSNTNELHARKFLVQFKDEFHYFRHLLLSHEVRARKPERAVFETATRLAGCRPEEILFFDDIECHVAGARAFGWNAVVFRGVEDLNIGRQAASGKDKGRNP